MTPSVEHLAAAIRAALADAAAADRAIAAARDRHEQALGLLAAVTEGTGSAEVSTALAGLADAQQRLDTARAAVAAAVRDVEQYLGSIGANPRSHGPAQPPPVEGEPDQPRPHDFQPAAARQVPTRRGTATAGILADERGIPISDGPLWSGSPAPTDTTRGVRSRRVARSFSNLHHVECHVAGLMRAGQAPAQAVLYINNAPCRGRTPAERGCHELLPGLLRPGQRLTVHVVDRDGTLQTSTVYTGTGEELAP